LCRASPASRRRKVSAALALALALALAPGSAGAQGDTSPPATPPAARPAAPADAYKLHMENGVKLYADKNFPAAVVEFQAAYEARPGPNPLVNVALCAKEMFRYPQAISALETALSKHGDAMDPSDKRAAEAAIKEMRALLGTVRVALTPPEATLLVDGEDLPAGAAASPIALGPGVHKVSARAEGYSSAEQSVSIASGREQTVTLALRAEKGRVTIEAPDPGTAITIDDQPVGNGSWSGLLSPGQHVVRMVGSEPQPYTMQIVVTAGVPLLVRKGLGGTWMPPPKVEEPTQRGFYVLGLGSMLFGIVHPPAFPPVQQDYGAAYGLRVGFQVNRIAGFEATYEHSSISTYAVDGVSSYRIIADRAVVGLRLISKGSLVRFAGSLGGGFVHDQMNVVVPGCSNNIALPYCFMVGNHVGVDAFALAEAGLELDLDHVLIDFLGEGQLQSTGNLSAVNNGSQAGIYGSLPLLNGGPAIRVGYRFW
jgi:hypothetical protein